MQQTTTAKVDNAYVGRDTQGRKVYIDIEVQHITGVGETIAHEPIEAWDRIGISASAVLPRHRNLHQGGQIIDVVREVTPDKDSAWTPEDLASLIRIWERWHLNDLHGGCEHVPTPVMEDGPYGPRPDLTHTPACPETGYRYGHAWLVEQPPAEILDEVRRLIRLPRGTVPAWLSGRG